MSHRKLWALGFLAVVGCCGLSWNLAQAAWITKQGVSWDTDWLPTEATVVHSPVSDPTASGSPVFIFGSGWNPSGWQTGIHQTVGELLVGKVFTYDGKNRSVNLGPGWPGSSLTYDQLYTEIELTWGTVNGLPRGFQNQSGDDLAIYENGYPPLQDSQGRYRGGSEVFLVSLGYYVQTGNSWSIQWTDYRYTKPSNYEPSAQWLDNNGNPDDGNFGETPSWGSGPTYLTLIDADDFGLAANTWIVGVRVRNAVYGLDWVTAESGEGWVVTNHVQIDGYYQFKDHQGRLVSTYYHPKYNTWEPRYDPDITIVVPLSSVGVVHTPEPSLSVLVISGLGTLLLARSWRKKRMPGLHSW